MFMETLTTGNVQVSGAEGEQTPEVLREKVLLNLCLYLALTRAIQVLCSTNFVKQKFNYRTQI